MLELEAGKGGGGRTSKYEALGLSVQEEEKAGEIIEAFNALDAGKALALTVDELGNADARPIPARFVLTEEGAQTNWKRGSSAPAWSPVAHAFAQIGIIGTVAAETREVDGEKTRVFVLRKPKA